MIKAVVFGSRRMADLWARENGVNPDHVMLASYGGDRLRGINEGVLIVRFPKEVWSPTTDACRRRCQETETALIMLENRLSG